MKSTFSVELKNGAQVSSLQMNSKDVLIEGNLGEVIKILVEDAVFTLECNEGTLRFDVLMEGLVKALRRKEN